MQSVKELPSHLVEGYSPQYVRMLERGEAPPEPPPGRYSTVRPARVVILAEAQSLTWGERDKEYGDPLVNLTCSRKLKDVFREYLKRPMSDAEMEALDMVLVKFSRIITGTPKQDSYIDLAGYAALAGEMAERTSELPQK